jgi:Leucine-rich repeat (LRR) protein
VNNSILNYLCRFISFYFFYFYQYPFFPPPEHNKLARLYLGGNRLETLPGDTLKAGETALVELDIQGNLLTEISADIGILKNLKVLNASNNSLSDIPYTLGYMASLQRWVPY